MKAIQQWFEVGGWMTIVALTTRARAITVAKRLRRAGAKVRVIDAKWRA
jgi:hypothetical protein